MTNLLAPWASYFTAQASAAGALTGLIFVALAFNFEHVIEDETWLGRAGVGLFLLAQPIVSALVCLWPTRTSSTPGATAAALGLLGAVILARIVSRPKSRTASGTTHEFATRLAVTLAEPITSIVGGTLVATNVSGGVFVLSAGAIIGLAVGLLTAWVLLVDVRKPKTQQT